ncbi:MAG: alpha/beta fold hydrolase, partial [Actinobacteria bacterium]
MGRRVHRRWTQLRPGLEPRARRPRSRAARRPRRDREELRADPPAEPDRAGSRPAALQGRGGLRPRRGGPDLADLGAACDRGGRRRARRGDPGGRNSHSHARLPPSRAGDRGRRRAHPLPPRAAAGRRLNATASVVLVHGAGSGPWVFAGWENAFPGRAVATVDLHTGLEIGRASMLDYADAVVAAAARTAAPAALVGWSMGGLAVLMAADRVQPSCLVLLESSPPGETQGFATAGPEIEGTFDPEAVYGAFPVGVGSRHESLRARAERKHGISVPDVSCPTLVVTSREFEGERGDPVARLYGAERLHFP